MSASSCPTDDDLTAFVRKALDHSRMDTIASHVVRCTVCEQKLGMVADFAPTMTETIVPVHPAGAVAVSGALLGDRYVLRDRLGAGGMGYVYRAEQVRPVQRSVAVKVMRPGMDSDEFLARFEEERQAVARMDHPNIARVFDAGSTSDGRPFLALELVDGLPVTRWCDKSSLSVRERVALFVPVCRAVQHAHLKGVIHRDLKPSNILVAEVDGRPVPKVIDFGIAKATGRGAGGYTQTGVVIGTPEYMSPEQAGLTGADVDTRSDVYALGVVLYELLVGTTPFPPTSEGGSVWDLLRKVREEDPPTPGSKLGDPQAATRLAEARKCSADRLRREMGGELQWVVMRALERDRERRYQSANALADDLERYLREEPLDAGPPTPLYRARKFVARNRVGVLAASAVLVALLAAVAGTSAGLVRSLRAEGQAREALAAEETARRDAEQSADQARREKEAALRATAEAESARKAAERSQAEAVRAQLRTRVALFAITDFITGGPFGRGAQVTPAEQQFLAGILALLQRFGTADPDGLAADVRGECLFRVGLLQLRLGQEGPGEITLRETLAVWERLHAESPAAPIPRLEMAKVCSELGWVMVRKNRPDAAIELLDRAVALAEALAKDFPTATHRASTAKARGIRGDFHVLRGDTRQAVDELTAATDLLERLVDEGPPDFALTCELAIALDKLGAVYDSVRDEPKAKTTWEKSRMWFERLAEEHPRDLEVTQSLARVITALARRTNGADGTDLYRQALAVRKRLMTDYPAVPQYRVEYAVTAANLAARLCDAGDLKGAEPLAADALAIRTRLAADYPAQSANKLYLAHSLCVSGRFAGLCGKADAAAQLLDRAAEVIDPMFAREPRRPLCREIHATCHTERANQREGKGLYTEAADDWEAASASANDPGEKAARRVRALAKTGKFEAASVEAAAVREKYPRDWRTQFALARAYAVLAEAEPTAGHAGTAAECLRTAVDNGLSDRPDRKWEPDLDPIRAHKDVAAALDRLKSTEVLPRPRSAEQ